jgi:DHA1 family bicyclomycin/chloramphenicol resistance-like MFS transporter
VARGYARLLTTRPFLRYALIVGFNSAAFFAFIAAAPHLVIDVLGERPSSYGIWFLAISATFIGGNLSGGMLSRRLGIDRMIGLGNLLSLLACACLVVSSLVPLSMPAIFLPMAMTALANGWVQPNALAGAVGAAPHLAGSAAGLTGFSQMAIGAVLTLLVGAVMGDRLLEPALVMVGTLLAGLAVYRLLVPPARAPRAG